MSKDKYLSIFLKSNGGYCVHYPANINFFKIIGEYHMVASRLVSLLRIERSKFEPWLGIQDWARHSSHSASLHPARCISGYG